MRHGGVAIPSGSLKAKDEPIPARKIGRPCVRVRPEQVRQLLREGLSLRQTAIELGIGLATAGRLRDAITHASQNDGTPPQNSCRTRSEDIPHSGPTQPSGAPETLEAHAPDGDVRHPGNEPETADPVSSEVATESEDDAPGGIRPISVRRRDRPKPPSDDRKPMTPSNERWRPYDGGRLSPCPNCALRRHRINSGFVICDNCFPLRGY